MTVKNWNSLSFLERLFPWYEGSTYGPSIEKLEWDSAYWGTPFIRINGSVNQAELSQTLSEANSYYAFAEVPVEEIAQLRLLEEVGFRMVETRLTYFHALGDILSDGRRSRMATVEDVPFLKNAAGQAVNPFDKYHADPFFSESMATQYLETYIENCVRGFAECVFVPDLESPPFAFAALSKLKLPGWNNAQPLFRIPLTACLPTQKGWHFDLCLAALKYAKNEGAAGLVMTTQATNKAVIHNCEKLGFKLGSCTLVVSTYKRT